MGQYVMNFGEFTSRITVGDSAYDGDEYSLLRGYMPPRASGDFYQYCDDNGVMHPIEFIKQDGGGEGGTEYCETIFRINGEFYKVTYSYYSHHGYETDNAEVYKVVAEQKTITVYN